MKLYREAPQASIKMSDDPALIASIDAAIKTYGITTAIETGTYHGTGSTRIIADSLQRNGHPNTYVTIEVGFENWCAAYRNLSSRSFVDCRWGCSVDRDGAIDFIRNDEAIRDHRRHPDIYIDDVENPLLFYTNEVNGVLGVDNGFVRQVKNLVKSMSGSAPVPPIKELWSGESLLPRFLRLHHDRQPLVILDSAGGCGLYEFQITMEIMKDARFLLLLDDTHHLKHFRSLQHVKANSRFTLLDESEYHGWALAWYE